MDYHLPPHISLGAVGPCIIMLDLDADRYFRLHGADAAMIAGLAGSRPAASTMAHLAAKGIVATGPGPAIELVSAPQPQTSAIEDSGDRLSIGVAEVLSERLRAAMSLRVRGLSATVRRLRAERSSKRPISAVDDPSADAASGADRIARGYAAARLHMPLARLCVPDSAALLRCLWRRGVDADLFFGVRLDPFAAHAWIQRGDRILSDSVGIVSEYRAVFRL